jgi:membrane fusion protein
MDHPFRKEVPEAQREPWMGTVEPAAPLSFVLRVLPAAGLAAAIVLFLIFGQYTRRATASGPSHPVPAC